MITLEIKKIVLVFFVLCISLTNTSTASELVHEFGNPSFSKKGYSQHALSIEQLQYTRKNDVIKDMGYQCKSCIYCQASVSLLSRKIKEKKVKEIISFIAVGEQLFNDAKVSLEKHWKDFKEILDKKNLSRKECLLLPLRTIAKALKN